MCAIENFIAQSKNTQINQLLKVSKYHTLRGSLSADCMNNFKQISSCCQDIFPTGVHLILNPNCIFLIVYILDVD